MNWWPFRKKKPVEHRFTLDHKAFACLVRGGQLTFVNKDGVQVHLILNDIGYWVMRKIIDTAEEQDTSNWIEQSMVVKQ